MDGCQNDETVYKKHYSSCILAVGGRRKFSKCTSNMVVGTDMDRVAQRSDRRHNPIITETATAESR